MASPIRNSDRGCDLRRAMTGGDQQHSTWNSSGTALKVQFTLVIIGFGRRHRTRPQSKERRLWRAIGHSITTAVNGVLRPRVVAFAKKRAEAERHARSLAVVAERSPHEGRLVAHEAQRRGQTFSLPGDIMWQEMTDYVRKHYGRAERPLPSPFF